MGRDDFMTPQLPPLPERLGGFAVGFGNRVVW
jgi:hypothetical protein